MFGEMHRRRYRGLASGLLSVGVIGAILAMTLDIDLPSTGHAAVPAASSTQCGPATAATIAGVDDSVAQRIYAGELSGRELGADVAHVTGSAELLTALDSADQRAVYAAVHALVYTPHWHIVRLRVLQHGRVLADVGGPDIIAPISGTLRFKGRTVGSFVMSVQDDLGYVKLVSRFIGVPIDLYRAGSFVMGTLQPPPPASVSSGESLAIGQSDYQAALLSTTAFPAGTLKVTLFVPAPASTLAARSCCVRAPGGMEQRRPPHRRSRHTALGTLRRLPRPASVGIRRLGVREVRIGASGRRRPRAYPPSGHRKIPRANVGGPLLGGDPSGPDLLPHAHRAGLLAYLPLPQRKAKAEACRPAQALHLGDNSTPVSARKLSRAIEVGLIWFVWSN